jgi:hypothetical protein
VERKLALESSNKEKDKKIEQLENRIRHLEQGIRI